MSKQPPVIDDSSVFCKAIFPSRKAIPSLDEFANESSVAVDMLDETLTNVFFSSKRAQVEPLTAEQRLIMRWLQVEIEEKDRGNVRRIDWDGKKERFIESTLYRSAGNQYAFVRDWRDKGEHLHDQEFLNLEERNPTLEHWLQAVAELLAQRYAISRFRVYRISPLRHLSELKEERASLVIPEFQSGAGIDPDTDSWYRTGFRPEDIPHIDRALRPGYTPLPGIAKRSNLYIDIPRVQHGKEGNSRVLFPVHHPESKELIALLAMDRRLDHAGTLEGFDGKVVKLAARMAMDQVGVLSGEQWGLMRGLVEDIGRRVALWLEDDEKNRTAEWHKSTSRSLKGTFADSPSSPEMVYDGISQVCAALAEKWNEEEAKGKKVSGHVRGTTPWSEETKAIPRVSSWYIVLVGDPEYWRVVAGWGAIYEECHRIGGRMAVLHDAVEQSNPWEAIIIQDFQRWSKEVKEIPYGCPDGEMREGIGSWLAVPMQVEGRIQALMVVHSPHACYFTGFHAQLMEYAAERLLPLLAAALREARTRNAFTAAVMHEVKNDSHAALELLDEIRHGLKETQQPEALIELRHHLEGLNALGKDTLDIFRTGSGGERPSVERKEDSITTSLGDFFENATLGWRTLYEDARRFKLELPDVLAARRVTIPRILDLRRVLRVLLHNAFRHGQSWVHVAVGLDTTVNTGMKLWLTITNDSLHDTVLDLANALGSPIDRPSASPLVRGRLGLKVAGQLTTEAGGTLGGLQYTKKDDELAEAEIKLSWPISAIHW